jgi:protein-S-isoprenylcysteine O-methyltransferase Ste14
VSLALDLLVALVSVAIIAQHAWATRGHFVSEGLTLGSAVIAGGVAATTVIYLALGFGFEQPPAAQLIGLAIELGGLWLFWAAIRASRAARLRFAFDTEGPQGLLTTGPYARIRHPFYASYLLVWIGWAVATWTLFALIPLLFMVVVYAVAARFEERLFANTPLATDYAAYRKRAGLFWPKP